MKFFRCTTCFILLVALGLYMPQKTMAESNTTLLHRQELTDMIGKEGMVLTVEFSPGEISPVHRHNAHTFVYVLEGSVIFQVEGGKAMILKTGETFYESPQDIHKVSKNASDTQPAKFLVFFVKDKGAPALIPIH